MISAELTPLLITAMGLGFMGSGHCVGMCGGIVTAISSPAMSTLPQTPMGVALSQLLFSIGRLGSYVIVGGLLATVVAQAASPAESLGILRWLAAIMTIAIGLSITGWLQLLKPLETAGGWFWAKIQPLTKPLIPAKSPAQLLALGMLWGWLPCGLVYSAASYALVAGNVVNGAFVMLAFGLGTLPAMLLTGFSAQWAIKKLRSPGAKIVFGVVVIVMGVFMVQMQLGGHESHSHHGHGDHQHHEKISSSAEEAADTHHEHKSSSGHDDAEAHHHHSH